MYFVGARNRNNTFYNANVQYIDNGDISIGSFEIILFENNDGNVKQWNYNNLTLLIFVIVVDSFEQEWW